MTWLWKLARAYRTTLVYFSITKSDIWHNDCITALSLWLSSCLPSFGAVKVATILTTFLFQNFISCIRVSFRKRIRSENRKRRSNSFWLCFTSQLGWLDMCTSFWLKQDCNLYFLWKLPSFLQQNWKSNIRKMSKCWLFFRTWSEEEAKTSENEVMSWLVRVLVNNTSHFTPPPRVKCVLLIVIWRLLCV